MQSSKGCVRLCDGGYHYSYVEKMKLKANDGSWLHATKLKIVHTQSCDK